MKQHCFGRPKAVQPWYDCGTHHDQAGACPSNAIFPFYFRVMTVYSLLFQLVTHAHREYHYGITTLFHAAVLTLNDNAIQESLRKLTSVILTRAQQDILRVQITSHLTNIKNTSQALKSPNYYNTVTKNH